MAAQWWTVVSELKMPPRLNARRQRSSSRRTSIAFTSPIPKQSRSMANPTNDPRPPHLPLALPLPRPRSPGHRSARPCPVADPTHQRPNPSIHRCRPANRRLRRRLLFRDDIYRPRLSAERAIPGRWPMGRRVLHGPARLAALSLARLHAHPHAHQYQRRHLLWRANLFFPRPQSALVTPMISSSLLFAICYRLFIRSAAVAKPSRSTHLPPRTSARG